MAKNILKYVRQIGKIGTNDPHNVYLGRWGSTISGTYQGYDCAHEFRYQNKTDENLFKLNSFNKTNNKDNDNKVNHNELKKKPVPYSKYLKGELTRNKNNRIKSIIEWYKIVNK